MTQPNEALRDALEKLRANWMKDSSYPPGSSTLVNYIATHGPARGIGLVDQGLTPNQRAWLSGLADMHKRRPDAQIFVAGVLDEFGMLAEKGAEKVRKKMTMSNDQIGNALDELHSQIEGGVDYGIIGANFRSIVLAIIKEPTP